MTEGFCGEMRSLLARVAQLTGGTSSANPADGDGAAPTLTEKYLAAIIAASDDGILVLDDDGKFEFSNRAYCRILGWPEDELLDEHFLKFIAPDHRERASREWDNALRGQDEPFDIDIVRKDGTRRSLFISRRRAEITGRWRHCVVVRDITERKRALEKLGAIDRRYHVLVETMNDGLAVIDENAAFTFVNRRMAEMIGYTPEEMVGRLAMDFHDEAGRKIIAAAFERRKTEGFVSYEVNIVGKDGRQVPVIMSPSPLKDAGGGRPGTFAVITDVSELKRAQAVLAKTADDLEEQVAQRTGQLTRANEELRVEVARRAQAEKSLQAKNIALRELLSGIEEEKADIGRSIHANMAKIVLPMLDGFEGELSAHQHEHLDLIRGSLREITSPFAETLSKEFATLTAKEVRVCNLIRGGMSGKQIGALEHISTGTVNKHRQNIRRKLGLTNTKMNLRSYLENTMSKRPGR